jgi:hypothetical protein
MIYVLWHWFSPQQLSATEGETILAPTLDAQEAALPGSAQIRR